MAFDVELHQKQVHRLAIGFSVIVVAALTILVWFAVARNNAAHNRFMEQCMQDHKEYECTAMWRAGDNSQSPSIIMLPAPSGR